MSLPPIFAPYPIRHTGGKQRYYIDGEIRETLSTHVAKDNGCDLLICSYTHQPYHFKEDIGSLFNYGIAAVVIQTVYQSQTQTKSVRLSQGPRIKNARRENGEGIFPGT